jgi:hypothetical protein
MRNAARGWRPVTHHRKLARVNAFRTKFARLIHANHPVDGRFTLRCGF